MVVADCSMRSEARFPDAFSKRANLVVGPLVLVGGAAHTPARVVREFGGNKFPLLVRNGHRVTVELPPATRQVAGLAYGRLPEGEVRLRDAHPLVTFIACRRGEPSGSSAAPFGSRAGGWPVTFWSGFVLARSPMCVPLRVWVDDERSPRRVWLRLGVRRCPAPRPTFDTSRHRSAQAAAGAFARAVLSASTERVCTLLRGQARRVQGCGSEGEDIGPLLRITIRKASDVRLVEAFGRDFGRRSRAWLVIAADTPSRAGADPSSCACAPAAAGGRSSSCVSPASTSP